MSALLVAKRRKKKHRKKRRESIVAAERVSSTRTLCEHCGERPISRPRALCFNCYYKPGVREQYAPVSIHGYRGIPDFYGALPLPAEPTDALPGTEEKMRVMAERMARGEHIHHPLDGRLWLVKQEQEEQKESIYDF